jgi:hypothetical protein
MASVSMAQTIWRFAHPVRDADARLYDARVCGGPMPGGTWEGWLEFVPLAGGDPVRSSRETTQPNRADLEYWATGLTDVYLEGALQRALQPLTITSAAPLPPPIFDGPAPHVEHRVSADAAVESVLDPFSVYEKGEAVLRQQLAALSAWHIVNILVDYDLTDEDASVLNRLPAPVLMEKVIAGVRRETPSAVGRANKRGAASQEDGPGRRSHRASR